MVQENRAFLAEAVTWAASQGVGQFIDLGAAPPATPAVHQTAQRSARSPGGLRRPGPTVLAHGRALLAAPVSQRSRRTCAFPPRGWPIRTWAVINPAEPVCVILYQTGLNAEQRDAVQMMLPLPQPPQAESLQPTQAKVTTMAEFARLSSTFTGRRVIGLDHVDELGPGPGERAPGREPQHRPVLGKTEGLRRAAPSRAPAPGRRSGPDEASQLSTTDLALIGEAARHAGARIIATGDVAQLGAVEAGGMFRLFAQGSAPPSCTRSAGSTPPGNGKPASSSRRRPAAIAAYDRHGRIRGAGYEAAYDRAASMWLATHMRGKDVLLLAGSNVEAADLARRVQARLAQLGTIGPPQAALSDGNQAGIGDLIRARLNTHIDAAGRPLTNRDTLQITAFRGPDAEVRRQRLDGTWTGTFRIPSAYLAASAELAYAGTSTSPRAAPSTPPTSWSPSRYPGRPCTSA